MNFIVRFLGYNGEVILGLVPTFTLMEIPSGILTINNQNMTHLSMGIYLYTYDIDQTKDYCLIFKSNSDQTVDSIITIPIDNYYMPILNNIYETQEIDSSKVM